MRVRFLGHAAFLLTASDGTRIITDPYEPGAFGGAISYGPIAETADFVTVSHSHADHNHVAGLPGRPVVISAAGPHRAGRVGVTGTPTHHDQSQGSERGPNLVFVFEDAGLRVCHCGDLGCVPERLADSVGRVDVLLVPVGGHFTIGAAEAHRLTELLGARVVIPMHFATDKTKMPIAGVEDFVRSRENVNVIGGSDTEITAATLPGSTETKPAPGAEIRVLKHAL